jgi:hypothetical protein
LHVLKRGQLLNIQKLIPYPLRVLMEKSAKPLPSIVSGGARAPVVGLSVAPFGRFGNNLIQLSNAIILAKANGYKYIRVAKMPFLKLTEPVDIGGVTLLPAGTNTRPYGTFIKGRFYFCRGLAELGLTPHMHRSISRNHIRPLMDFGDVVQAPLGELAIHIRSGDVFSPRPNPGYTQPPLAFYTKLLRDRVDQGDVDRVVLVFEDRVNPCIEPLERFARELGITVAIQSGSLRDDFTRLLGARQLLCGQGTFGPAVFNLSHFAEQMDVFDTHHTASHQHVAGYTYWTAKPDSYVPIGEWKNTDAQRLAMIEMGENDVVETHKATEISAT